MGLLDNFGGPMSGILNQDQKRQAMSQALMSFGGNMMANGGWQKMPTTTGQALGKAMPSFLSGYNGSVQQALQANLYKQNQAAHGVKMAQAKRVQDYNAAVKRGVRGPQLDMLKRAAYPQETMKHDNALTLHREKMKTAVPKSREKSLPNGMMQDEQWNGQTWVPYGQPYNRHKVQNETWHNPTKMMFGGKPAMVQYSNLGNQRVIDGAQPMPGQKGMSVTTNPDGTTSVSWGGTDGAGGGDITNSTKGKLEQAVVDTAKSLGAYDRISASYNPDSLTYQGAAEAKGLEILEKMSPSFLNDDQREVLGKHTMMKSDVLTNLSAEIKAFAGAAVSKDEYKRISAGMPTMDDSATVFQTKIKASRKALKHAHARAQYFLKRGVVNATPEMMERQIPLGRMDKMMKSVADRALESAMSSNPDLSGAEKYKIGNEAVMAAFGVPL